MFAKVHPAKDVQSGNTGSCHDLVHYLQKRRHWRKSALNSPRNTRASKAAASSTRMNGDTRHCLSSP